MKRITVGFVLLLCMGVLFGGWYSNSWSKKGQCVLHETAFDMVVWGYGVCSASNPAFSVFSPATGFSVSFKGDIVATVLGDGSGFTGEWVSLPFASLDWRLAKPITLVAEIVRKRDFSFVVKDSSYISGIGVVQEIEGKGGVHAFNLGLAVGGTFIGGYALLSYGVLSRREHWACGVEGQEGWYDFFAFSSAPGIEGGVGILTPWRMGFGAVVWYLKPMEGVQSVTSSSGREDSLEFSFQLPLEWRISGAVDAGALDFYVGIYGEDSALAGFGGGVEIYKWLQWRLGGGYMTDEGSSGIQVGLGLGWHTKAGGMLDIGVVLKRRHYNIVGDNIPVEYALEWMVSFRSSERW